MQQKEDKKNNIEIGYTNDKEKMFIAFPKEFVIESETTGSKGEKRYIVELDQDQVEWLIDYLDDQNEQIFGGEE